MRNSWLTEFVPWNIKSCEQDKETDLEKLNESKSELVWLLKEVIIAEKKRKILLEKEKKG